MIKNERHALYCGWVAGMAAQHGIPLSGMMDENGDWTNRLALQLRGAPTIVLVIPEPPDDWTLS